MKAQRIEDFETVVVGAGLTGLAIAKILSEKQKVAILEASDRIGANHRAIQTPFGVSENGLRFFPATENARQFLALMKRLIPELSGEIVELSPATIEDGAVRDFVGFGEKTPEHYEGLNYFLSNRRIQFSHPVHQWPELLKKDLQAEIFFQSQVSKFEVDGKQVSGVVVNGQKTIHPNQIFFAAPLSYLKGLFVSTPKISSKIQNEFPRHKFVTAVQIDYVHKPELTEHIAAIVSKENADRVFCQSTMSNGEPYYCAGQFGLENKISQWIGFISDDESEDPDQAGEALKKIKRAIKRAIPDFFDKVQSERISIIPSAISFPHTKLRPDLSLSFLHNLWLASGDFTEVKNLMGSLERAQALADALGCDQKTESVFSELVSFEAEETQDQEVLEDQNEDSHREMDASL